MKSERLKEFGQHLEMMRVIHEKKNKDYADESNPLENFERTATVLDWFHNPRDQAYVALIVTKLARLATLLNKEFDATLGEGEKVKPENEPVTDSFLDLNTYSNLWWCDYDRRDK